MAELSPKQQMFVEEYMVDLNATQAAIRAGYSPKTAYRTGSDNLKKPQIAKSIAEKRQQLTEKTAVTVERIVTELAKIAFSNMQDYAKWSPRGVILIDSEDITADQAAAISELSETTTDSGGSIRFKLHDKKGALELLGRHLGMFKDKVELEVVGSIADQLKAAREALRNGPK